MMPIDTAQYGFALHTTSSQLGLAVSNFRGDSRSSTWDLGRDLSSHLHQYLLEFLAPQKWSDLAFLAVAKGPGSFTSTRIGVVTARTLAQQLEVPLFAVSTLASFAWSQLSDQERVWQEKAIALQMPAQRNQLFTAVYQVSPALPLIQLLPDSVMTPQTWQQTLDNLEIPFQLINVPVELGYNATSLLEVAYQDWQLEKPSHWSEALPFYGQHPIEQ